MTMALASQIFAVVLRVKRVLTTGQMITVILLSGIAFSWGGPLFAFNGVILFVVQAVVVARTGWGPNPVTRGERDNPIDGESTPWPPPSPDAN